MNMSLAVRQVSVERGYDPRDFVMVGFGGAGPLHAAEVARSLHIPLLVIPNFPGQFSASGMLLAEQRHDFVRTYYRALDRTDFGELAEIAAGMEALARERMANPDRDVDIRIVTLWKCATPVRISHCPSRSIPRVTPAITRPPFATRFTSLHQSRFGYHDPHLAVEIVNAHLTAAVRPTLDALPAPPRHRGQTAAATRKVVFDAGPVDCPVYLRESLASGQRVDGPAIIQEYASTIALFPQDRAEVTASGELLVQVGGEA